MATQGLTNAEIAERMHVTVHAVKIHLAAIFRKPGRVEWDRGGRRLSSYRN